MQSPNHRPHADLSSDELRQLWTANPDAAFFEWSFRLPDYSDFMGGGAEAARWLVRTWVGESVFERTYKHSGFVWVCDDESESPRDGLLIGALLIEGNQRTRGIPYVYHQLLNLENGRLPLTAFLYNVQEFLKSRIS